MDEKKKVWKKKTEKKSSGKKKNTYSIWNVEYYRFNVRLCACARSPRKQKEEEKKHIEIQVNIFFHTYHHRYNITNEQRNDDTSTFGRAIIVLKPKAPRDYNTLG